MAFQLVQVLQGETTHFRPWDHEGLQLPNTEFYMTRAGLSYKFRTAYCHNTWRLPFAVEYVFNGDKQVELTLGAETQVEPFSERGTVVLGRALELETEVGYVLNRWFHVAMGYSLYHVRNLHGERMIPSLEDGASAHRLFARAAFAY